ncbi:hypothetical protein LINPERHAP1_LOCUS26603 [Linum perenne]
MMLRLMRYHLYF